jgi:hypothetical protein
MTKQLTKAQLKARKKFYRHYGMVKLFMGQKFAWLSKQDKNGWSLGLAVGGFTIWLKNVRFATSGEVQRAIASNIVFVEVKNK